MKKRQIDIEEELSKVQKIDYDALLEASESFSSKYDLEKRKKTKMLQTLEEYKDMKVLIPTGISAFDEMLEGGIPAGKIIEIFGRESTAKSSLCMKITSSFPTCIYIDCESSFEKERALQFGISEEKRKNFFVAHPETGEQAVDLIKSFADACSYPGALVIIVDSVAAMVPEKQLIIDEKDTSGRQAGVALTATLLSRHISSIANKCRLHGATVIFVNQLRSRIGFTFPFGDNTYKVGGWALKYALTLDIQLVRKALLKVGNVVLGIRLASNVVKNKITFPFQFCEFDFILDTAEFIPIEREKQALKEAKKRYNERKKAYLQAIGQSDTESDMIDDVEELVVSDDEDEL